ncbi:phage baseplate assembly protein V, partial [Chryseobacterium artocarpi]|uniref:phage baseplate assembly protein V n=1 Tax=Chryseobacterium artocarpi TaxID=1414727 RepID=UPI000AF74095
TVIANADPEGQGRVQVRFDWQMNDTTHFVRVMSPDAGGTDQITQNRGYVAIPEVGDQVMVNFVHSHPDRPFVMGGMFHGGIGLGGGVNNHMRSIQTKSGIKVLMNDDEKSVTIIDPSGNTYFMDGNGNISVTAPNDITFTAGKNMNINVGENMTTSVGMNKSDNITMNHTESVGMMKNLTIGANFMTNVVGSLMEFVKGNRESKAQEVKEQAKARMIVSQENNNIHSQKTFNNNSGESSKIH